MLQVPAEFRGLREVSLFSGAGGGVLASKLLGWRTVAYVEWEKFPQAVLGARIKDGLLDEAPIFGDVREFDGTAWKGTVDVVSGGFPCQPFSLAGKQGAQDDERNMWPDTLRIIREVQPRFAFLENVPGLLSASHGYFGTILSDLANIGYEAVWDVIPASAVGAPHRRDRMWLLARPARRRDPQHQSVLHAFAERNAENGWSSATGWRDQGTDWPRSGGLYLYEGGEVAVHRTPRMAFPEDIKTRYGVWPWPSVLLGDVPARETNDDRAMWMTPNTFDGTTPKSQAALDHEATHRAGRAAPNNLRDQVNVEEGFAEWRGADQERFPTPTSSMMTVGDMEQARFASDDARRPDYAAASEMWPTPMASSNRTSTKAQTERPTSGPSRGGASFGLEDAVAMAERAEPERDMWPTPRTAVASMYPESDEANANRGGESLATRVHKAEDRQNWPTPRTAGLVGGSSTYHFQSKLLADGTITEAEATSMFDGIGRDPDDDTPPAMLNPDWVEWLMNWPIGWTRLEPLDATAVDTWEDLSPRARWWLGEPEGLPRVTLEKTDRTARLKALGNGQVSLCAAAACAGLYETFRQVDASVERAEGGYSMDMDEFFGL